MLSQAEHEIFSANKYENANNSWHFHIYKQGNFHAELCLARKNLQLLVICDLVEAQISCLAGGLIRVYVNGLISFYMNCSSAHFIHISMYSNMLVFIM